MLAKDLRRLSDVFDGWCRGRPYPTPEAWQAFRRDLRHAAAKASLAELGVDPDLFKLAAACNEPGSNVRLFPTQHQRRVVPIGDGGAL